MRRKGKWISLLCVLCLLVSACSILPGKKEEGKSAEQKTAGEDKAKDKSNKDKSNKDKSNKDKPNQADKDGKDAEPEKMTKEEKPKFDEANVRKIAYADIVNSDIYTGFTKKQMKMLEKNGFVIMETDRKDYPYLKMHQPYEHMEYAHYSMMITTDVVLHMWHVFFAESMKALEAMEYLPNLEELSLNMEQQAIDAYRDAPDALDAAYANVMAFFHVANSLLFEEEPSWENKLTAKPNGDALEIAEAELANIKAESAANSVLLGGRAIDYSQFKPRGHYTTSPQLTRYFKAMMWYGFMGFDLKKQPEEAALIADLLMKNKDLMALWQKNYELTAMYSGESDDISVPQMQDALKSLKGKDLNQELINESGRKALAKAFQSLPEPRIVAQLSEENKDFEVRKNFKFMGQRFSVDAYIMQNLMKPIDRPQSSSFDVFAAMGSASAESYLRENYDTNQKWPEYDDKLQQMKEEYAAGELTDGDNFYNGWIRAIDRTLNYVPDGKEIPYFMTTPAYEYKKLNAALGSFAELKHDNILYSKQVMAEMGGPEENLTLHYLEPNEELYQELLTLSSHAEKLMKKAKLSEELIKPLTSIKATMKIFAEISRKELNGEKIAESELHELNYFGGLVEMLNSHYLYLLSAEGYDVDQPKTTALIADIATILPRAGMPGGIVEIATGYPYEIYALCHVNGVDFLAKGIVYSAFEFLNDERLTDEKWHQMLGMRMQAEGEYEQTTFDLSDYDRIRGLYPNYFKEYASTEPNQIKINYEAEVDWPALVK